MTKAISKSYRGAKRLSWLASAGLLSAVALGACGTPAATPPASQTQGATAQPPQTVSVELQTGKMDGRAGWPRLVPADISVKAGRPVRLVIKSYDDGAAPLVSALASYDKVQGGTETVGGTAVTSVPNAQVSHTFTVPQLGLNAVVPAAPANGSVTVVFTFTPKTSGTYTWKCFAPCGSGPDGMGGAMATMGWMEGTLKIS